ncbi:MAG: DMT family transporter [Crocinitomicaceae bacterium]|nr:DMT family transporter [Crocinitomicaceae bacterium]
MAGKYWFLLLLLSLIWGSSFILMKKGMYGPTGEIVFNSNQVATLRILLASLALLPFGYRAIKRIQIKKDMLYFLIVSICGNMLPAFLFTFAETGISSGFAGMLNSTTPIFTIFIGYGFFKIKMTWTQIVGSIIGSVGVVLLLFYGKSVSLQGDWEHIIAVVLATLCYATSLSTIRYKLSHYKSIDIAAIAFILLIIPSIIIFFLERTWIVFESNNMVWDNFIAICILGLIGTAFALFLFNNIIKNTSALFASSVTYFIPIVAVIIGFFFGERLSSYQILSMLIVLLGVFIANSKGFKNSHH